jgi:polysaccharide biosynthesis transport protein
MEIKKFLNIVRKHQYGLIIIPLLIMLITFLIVRKQPGIYPSTTRISAGLTQGEHPVFLSKEGLTDSKINQNFSNLIQTLQLKSIYDQVSYKLILHDMASGDEPFRKPSKLLKELNPSARKHAIEVYTKMYQTRQSLSLYDKDQNGLNEVIKSKGYDYISLKDKVKVYRVESSDFIDINYESENPLLSAFVVNTLTKEFISFYSSVTEQNAKKTVEFLGDLVIRKKDSLDRRMAELKNYKIGNHVLNLTEQEKNLFSRISDLETRLELTQKEVTADSGALRNIDSRLNPEDKQNIDRKLELVNKDIVAIQDRIKLLDLEYIKSNFDKNKKAEIDSLKFVLDQKVNQSTDKLILNPASSIQSLVAQKLKLQLEMELAKNSIDSYRQAIAELNGRLNLLVPHEAVVNAYEGDIEVANQEYMEILKKYNQANVDFNATPSIKQVEMAIPGVKQPSKKAILVLLSGIVSAVFYLLVLFILFYLDDSIKVAEDLANKTDLKVLGFLPVIKANFLDIQKLWSLDSVNPVNVEITKLVRTTRLNLQNVKDKNKQSSNSEFKSLIRATRFEINMALMGSRNLVVTSTTQSEGKTLFCLSLVSAYQMTNKKVLLIDGNFLSPDITEITQPKYYIEDYLKGKVSLSRLTEEGNISVLGNHGYDISLYEINGEYQIEQKLLELKDVFDIIIIEASALNTLNQSKEWIAVADRVLSVFEANASISHDMDNEIEYLRELDGKFIGFVLNKVTDIVKNPNFSKKESAGVKSSRLLFFRKEQA